MPELRLLYSEPTSDERADARWNMALDQALFEGVIEGRTPPTQRLYGWSPPAITLGHFQPAEMIDARNCRTYGVEVIRRLTGGGAVFHHGDLTGCLVVPQELLPSGVRDSYRVISESHAAAFIACGIPAAVGSKSAPLPRRLCPGYDCFARLTECDVGVDGEKIAGSAQRRKHNALLHHTSIVWAPQPPGLLAELLPGAAAVGTPRSVTELKPSLDRRAFALELAQRVAGALGLELIEGAPTPHEINRAGVLARELKLEA